MSQTSQPTCLSLLAELHKVCQFQSIEGKKVGRASTSELRRWFASGCVELNYERVAWNDPLPPVIKSLVLFPNNARKRCTLFHNPDVTLVQVADA